MKLKLFLLATSAVALASCSSDAVVEDNAAGNQIQFSATAGKASRAASYFCNAEKPSQFNVWASVNGKTYFENESFSLAEGASTWTIDGTTERYWPKEEVSFYAAKNQTAYNGTEFAKVNWTVGAPTIDMTVETSAAKQQDLLYAYTKATKKAENNKCVATLNFRHALSQVVFKAQNKNSKIYVEISEVQVANLQTKGTFKFPTDVTDANIQDHNQNTDLPATGIGEWENLSTPALTTTTDDFGAVKVAGDSKIVNLTNNETVNKEREGIEHSLIVLPQTLAAATINSTKKPGTEGAYFKVKCTIWNVSGENVSKENDVELYKGFIYIPVNVEWKVGKKYIYTFVFSEKGHAGYDEEGNNVLIPIEFNVTVDDFAKADTDFNGTVDTDNGNK